MDLEEVDATIAKLEALLADKADKGHTHEDLAAGTYMEVKITNSFLQAQTTSAI